MVLMLDLPEDDRHVQLTPHAAMITGRCCRCQKVRKGLWKIGPRADEYSCFSCLSPEDQRTVAPGRRS
jgi:hypothetical protein